MDFLLPRTVAVGAGTALFVCGWCFSAESRLRSLAFEVDGDVQPVMLHGMPRIDVLRAFHPGLDETSLPDTDPDSPDDPSLRSYRSGFWGIARVLPRGADGERELLLRAALDDGGEERVELARIPTTPSVEAPVELRAPVPAAGPLAAICMATYEPAIELFRRQIDSIRAQTHRNWVCVISDDGSAPHHVERIERAVAGDPRFTVHCGDRLGFYRNFERALALAPAEAELIALADQVVSAIGQPEVCLLDVRTDEEWTGQNKRGTKRGGRIPGAVHLEWKNYVNQDGTFKPADELRRMFAEQGVTPDRQGITY